MVKDDYLEPGLIAAFMRIPEILGASPAASSLSRA